MTQTNQQYSRLPKNVFSTESIDAIKNATTITPPPEKKYPYTGKREIDYAPKPQQAQETPGQQAAVQQTTAPTSQNDSYAMKELQNKVKALQEALDAQAKRIDNLLASQNQVIGEFNKMESQIKEIKNRPVEVHKASEPVHSAPADHGPLVNTTEHVNDSEFNSKKAIQQQQSGNGKGLNPEAFSVEKFFYYGK